MRSLLVSIILSSFLLSCSPDDITPVDSGFYNLKLGNSWVYYYEIAASTSTPEFQLTNVVDSIQIVAIETINGKDFYQFRKRTSGNELEIVDYNPNGETFFFRRDSSGYLIDEQGIIQFSNSDFSPRLARQEEWADIYELTHEDPVLVSVEAGEFSCLQMERYAYLEEFDYIQEGREYTYYAEGIGLVERTYGYVGTLFTHQRRLLRSFSVLD